MIPEIAGYIEQAPADQQPVLRELHAMIASALPQAKVEMSSSGFPVFTLNGQWLAGFATRKKSPMFYVMDGEVMRTYAERLGRLKTGNSCIEYRASKSLSLEEVRSLAQRMLVDVARRCG